MIQNDSESVNLFLSDVSPNDKPWDIHKANCVRISKALTADKEFAVRGYNLNECADWLIYTATDNQDKPLVLSNANFCRDRACPICQWRRALRWVATMHQQLPQVHELYPTHRWLFLTLTVKNCEIENLRTTIQDMNKAYSRMMRGLRKRMPEIGYIRTTEVTRAKDDTAHPHLHCMLLVPAEYFGKKYIKQTEWAELWQKALKCDYMPIVDIRVPKNFKELFKPENLTTKSKVTKFKSIIAELLKYSIKPSDLLKKTEEEDYEWLYEYLRQVKGLRFLCVGGVLKKLIKAEWAPDDEDNNQLIHINSDDDEEENSSEQEQLAFRFVYDRMLWRYKL